MAPPLSVETHQQAETQVRGTAENPQLRLPTRQDLAESRPQQRKRVRHRPHQDTVESLQQLKTRHRHLEILALRSTDVLRPPVRPLFRLT